MAPPTMRVIVFAKAPQPGRAKTRLIPALGADGAAALARRLLDHTLAEATQAGLGEVEWCRTPAHDPLWAAIPPPAGVTVSDQGEGDLGDRLARAASRSLQTGQPCVLIGTDCPALDRHALQQVGQALHTHEAVIVPAFDGGYVALGLRRFESALFRDMAWSTASVAATTIVRLESAGFTLHRLPPLHDIDEPADLAHLPSNWIEDIRHARC